MVSDHGSPPSLIILSPTLVGDSNAHYRGDKQRSWCGPFPDLVDKVERVLRWAALDPNRLKPEITGTMAMEEQHVIGVLRNLSYLGVRKALDDFGSDLSSLNYVRDPPVDASKIDKSFIHGLGEAPVNDAIVRLIVDSAHTGSNRDRRWCG